MTRLNTCLGVLVLVFLATPAAAEDRRIVTGKAQVLTLDTLKVGDKIVDLKWIEPLPAKQLGAWSFMKKYRWCCADLSQEDYEHTADE